MPEKLNYSGNVCGSGFVVSFSGLSLSLDQTYRVEFNSLNTIPATTVLRLNPTGYFLTPSETSPIIQTLFSSNSNISDNSSVNLIGLSIYDESNTLIHRDYKSIVCENLCGSGFPVSPTPTSTPTMTPTHTPTPTPTPQSIPTLSIRAEFDKLINRLPSCNNALVRAKAYGVVGQTYAYSFGTDMTGTNLNISEPSGYISIIANPTYVYTNITLPESCKDYALEFGLSDGTDTVQAAAIFRCGNC